MRGNGGHLPLCMGPCPARFCCRDVERYRGAATVTCPGARTDDDAPGHLPPEKRSHRVRRDCRDEPETGVRCGSLCFLLNEETTEEEDGNREEVYPGGGTARRLTSTSPDGKLCVGHPSLYRGRRETFNSPHTPREVLGTPFFPPTCYSKVLSMARELTQWAAHLKRDYETGYCMAHMPDLHLDVHNACVMHKIRTYISLIEELRQRRCAYTSDVRRLGGSLRQLFIFISQKCHGDLVFTIYDCAALEG